MKRSSLIAVVVAGIATAGLAEACGTGSTSIDCATATVPSFAKITAFAQCTSCHASTLAAGARQGAPTGIDYDTDAAAVNNIDSGLRAIDEGRMPPGGGLSSDELAQIETWASCGEPQ